MIRPPGKYALSDAILNFHVLFDNLDGHVSQRDGTKPIRRFLLC